MLLLNVQPSVKHHRFNRQIRSFIAFSTASHLFVCMFHWVGFCFVVLCCCCLWVGSREWEWANEWTNEWKNEKRRCACFIFVIFLGWKSIIAMLRDLLQRIVEEKKAVESMLGIWKSGFLWFDCTIELSMLRTVVLHNLTSKWKEFHLILSDEWNQISENGNRENQQQQGQQTGNGA